MSVHRASVAPAPPDGNRLQEVLEIGWARGRTVPSLPTPKRPQRWPNIPPKPPKKPATPSKPAKLPSPQNSKEVKAEIAKLQKELENVDPNDESKISKTEEGIRQLEERAKTIRAEERNEIRASGDGPSKEAPPSARRRATGTATIASLQIRLLDLDKLFA